MKFVFLSNYFNHHQKPFCEEMYKRLGADFVFISTSVMREERKKLGYAQDDFPPYVHLAYEGAQQRAEAFKLILDADVVLAGSAPNDMLTERIRQGKLLFRYSERPFKKKASFFKKVYYAVRFRQRDLWKKNIYMLCAGAYAAKDYANIGMYKNRMYKWGYFPSVNEYDADALLSRKKKNTLLWCGRFIDWKHPDDAVLLAKKLKEQGYDFCLNMIGNGVMEADLRQLVNDFDLTERVHFLGAMPPEQVRLYMEEAGIYLFTSDRQEGWGAVLNESINSCCAVVASSDIGSVPYLLKNNENGCIYESKNVNMMYDKVKLLLERPDEQDKLGKAAYGIVTGMWNAKTAVARILQLSEKLLAGEKNPYISEEGPCSAATRTEKTLV